MDGKEFYDAQEYIDKLSDVSSEEEEDFLDAQESTLDGGQDWKDNGQHPFLLHKLAFDGNVEKLREQLSKCSEEEKSKLDPQGNSVLHIGILRNNPEVLKVALETGVSSRIRNSRGWSALDEAIATKSKEIVQILYLHQIQETKAEMQKAKASLIQTLCEIPNYSMELSWQLGSPVIGYLLRKFAPHDTYKIYKEGSRIRVDGTLMGIEKHSSSIIPEWKRGSFSLLFDGSQRPSLVFLVFHETKEYLDLTEEKQERKKNGVLDSDIDVLITDGVGKTKIRAVDLRFKPVKGWLTAQQSEKIENWNTVVYEASGKMLAETRLKSNLKIPPDCTFDEYLKLKVSEDTVLETTVDPTTMSNQSTEKTPGKDGHGEKKPKAKKISGRCWMAEDFPMSLRQLLPLLDVVGHANKHLSRVSKFMRKYGDMNMFPVKIQVPLLLTVYLLVSFKKFKFANESKVPMELPEDYKRIKLEDVLSSAALGDLHEKQNTDSDDKNDMETFRQIERDTIEY